MNILFISHRIPYPPNKGDRIRSYNILKYLAKKHTVYLAFLIDNNENIKNIEPLNNMVEELYYEEISPFTKKVLSFQHLLGQKPLSVPYFYSKKLQHKINTLLDTVQMDTVFCFSSPTAEYVFQSRHHQGYLQKATLCMDLIDMDSDKWRQYALSSSGPMKWIYQREAKTLLAYEEKISRKFDSVILVSKAERRFKTHIQAENVSAISNGVDLEYFHPEYKSSHQKEGPMLVFTGAMDYRPNIEAVQWFTYNVLPGIQEKIPEVRFHIVGSKPDQTVKNLAKEKGVHIVGYVKDVRDYISLADVCVIPLHIARGLQNKVLEAMAMGRPVVCSPQAFEGIEATPGKDLQLADSSELFTQKVIELLTDSRKASVLGSNARQCIEDNYTWQQNLSALDELLADPPQKNIDKNG